MRPKLGKRKMLSSPLPQLRKRRNLQTLPLPPIAIGQQCRQKFC
jgi:hypothetical protein